MQCSRSSLPAAESVFTQKNNETASTGNIMITDCRTV